MLKYFLAVAQEQSITAATEVLHVTQPTLSRQLMNLEDELGKPLFVRGGRRLVLTDEGRILRRRAEEILGLAARAKAEINAEDSGICGDVYVGAGEMESVRFVMQAMKNVQEKHPGIVFNVQSGDSLDLLDKLDSGILDFAVVPEPFDGTKYGYIPLPERESWGVLMRRDSELAKKDAVRPEDLWDKPLILSRVAREGSDVQMWMHRTAAQLNIVGSYNLIYNGMQMVRQGIGCALCLDRLVNVTGESELTFRPFDPPLELTFYIVRRKNRGFSRQAQALFTEVERMTGVLEMTELHPAEN